MLFSKATLTLAILMPFKAMAQDTPSTYLGSLTDYLFVFFDGSIEADLDGVPNAGGYAGDIVVNGNANFQGGRDVAYAGTIYSSEPHSKSLRYWNAILGTNPDQSEAVYEKDALLKILEEDFDIAMNEICALAATDEYVNYDAEAAAEYCAAHPGETLLDFQNGIPEKIVIDVNPWRMDLTEYLYVKGDADDLIIFRWGYGRSDDGSCRYVGTVDLIGGAGVIPMGDLTPDRLVHVAGNLDSTMSLNGGRKLYNRYSKYSSYSPNSYQTTEYESAVSTKSPPTSLPQFPTTHNGTQVKGSSEWGPSNFFCGYWLTVGSAWGENMGQTSNLRDAVFIGGWYTTTSKFDMEKGGMHVPQTIKEDPTEGFDVIVTCNNVVDNPCYNEGDLRGIALLGLTKAMVVSVYEGNGPGEVGSNTTVSDIDGAARRKLRGSAGGQNHRDLVVNLCFTCTPGLCGIFGCKRRALEEAVENDVLPTDTQKLRRRLYSDQAGGGNVGKLDYTDVEFPLIREHHSLLTLYNHYGYSVSPSQRQCITESYCTLTYTMYQADSTLESPGNSGPGNGNNRV